MNFDILTIDAVRMKRVESALDHVTRGVFLPVEDVVANPIFNGYVLPDLIGALRHFFWGRAE